MTTEDEFLSLVQQGDASAVASMLRAQPQLARMAGEYDKTGLHWAAESDWADVAQILVDAGADIEAKTSWNASPLEWAATMGSGRVAELLLARGARGFTLVVAAALGKLDAVRDRLESGDWAMDEISNAPEDQWPADSARARGDTLSHAMYGAARNGHTAVVEYLLDRGADVNAKGFFGGTGLHWAAINGHRSTVDLLVTRGADLSIRDVRFTGTPADWAREGNHLDIAKAIQPKVGN